jgi:hypothetical protein
MRLREVAVVLKVWIVGRTVRRISVMSPCSRFLSQTLFFQGHSTLLPLPILRIFSVSIFGPASNSVLVTRESMRHTRTL